MVMILEIKEQIKSYTDKLNIMKTNLSNEIDSMNDAEQQETERLITQCAGFIQSLNHLKTSLKGNSIFATTLKLCGEVSGDSIVDNFEIHPVAIADKVGDIYSLEQCEENDPELAMWSLYIHYQGGGLDAIADCETKEEAQALEAYLKALIVNYKQIV